SLRAHDALLEMAQYQRKLEGVVLAPELSCTITEFKSGLIFDLPIQGHSLQVNWALARRVSIVPNWNIAASGLIRAQEFYIHSIAGLSFSSTRALPEVERRVGQSDQGDKRCDHADRDQFAAGEPGDEALPSGSSSWTADQVR
ncbi:hypothetical protein, partial [Glycomyces salinus]|uniref:hypothetical protein n=1 Tax=Glycomyces salinus TaxID=980294 RepID=UPI001E331E5E